MAPTPFVQPNLYQLSGAHLHVSFLTHSGPATPEFPQGPPHFTYQDTNQTLSFSGNQIEVVTTELGQIVSVRIRLTVDAGSTTFSVLIPRVNLSPGQPANIQTQGITAIHRFSVLPGLNHGQQDFYTVTPLHGTAARAIVPL
jgi:hypothetical protein